MIGADWDVKESLNFTKQVTAEVTGTRGFNAESVCLEHLPTVHSGGTQGILLSDRCRVGCR